MRHGYEILTTAPIRVPRRSEHAREPRDDLFVQGRGELGKSLSDALIRNAFNFYLYSNSGDTIFQRTADARVCTHSVPLRHDIAKGADVGRNPG